MTTETGERRGTLGLLAVSSIGIGGMVGGGIFAVLGLAVQLTRGGAPLAFALAGVVALLTSYSYAHLSVTFRSEGGTVEFLNRAFGPGLASGAANILLWISYVVMLSLYAAAFGSYGASFLPAAWHALVRHILISAVVVGLTLLNLAGSSAVGRAETWIVAIKIAILGLFVAAGLWSVDTARLAPAQWSRPLSLVAGGMLIFLAYEGFELIANAAVDARSPERTLPRAFFGSVLFVIVLYVLVAAVTVGQLPVARIVAARDYALAAAAEPFFGRAGFSLIAAAALLSTASAINATLYGATRVSYIIAREGELPEVLERKMWHRPVEGLLVTSGLTLLVANLFDLSSISMMGSAGFLLIFAAVNVANVRCADRTGSRRWISATAVVACLLALAALLVRTAMDTPAKLTVLAAMLALSVGIEASYRRYRKRRKKVVKFPRR
ncbi:MAG TPA: APC family permease [Gammaproteobacteria bacterium]|nr:APC family permease [Gammaproteobacteria bacterium]